MTWAGRGQKGSKEGRCVTWWHMWAPAGVAGEGVWREKHGPLNATPSSPPCLPTPSALLSLFSLFPQIETTQLEPEIAQATSSRTVVYNKGL